MNDEPDPNERAAPDPAAPKPELPEAPKGKALRKLLLERMPKLSHQGYGLVQATAIQGADELEAIVDVDAEAYVSALGALAGKRGTR
jgi:hypothetical protein